MFVSMSLCYLRLLDLVGPSETQFSIHQHIVYDKYMVAHQDHADTRFSLPSAA